MFQRRDPLCRWTKPWVVWAGESLLLFSEPEQGEQYKITGILHGLFPLCFVLFAKGAGGGLIAAEINCLPVLLFFEPFQCPFLWLDWFLRADSYLDYFLIHANTLHGKFHAPIQLLSLCPSAVVAGGFSPLPQRDLVLQQISLLNISVLLM